MQATSAIPAEEKINDDAVKASDSEDTIGNGVIDGLDIDYPKKVDTSVAVVIPAFNESLTIGSVVLEAMEYCNRVYVVNDGSNDNTAELAKLAGATVINMKCNSGKAAALMRGLIQARDDDFDVAVMMDGDGQHKSIDIPILLAHVIDGSSDMVIGSRFMKEDNSIPGYRKVGQRTLNRFTNVGSKSNLTDTQCGFRALNKKALDNLDFTSAGYSVESDMITHFYERGLRIMEVPVHVEYDVPNGHKQGSTSMGFTLLNNVITTIGYKRPLLLFGVPGLAMCILGIMLGFLSIDGIYLFGKSWLMQPLVGAFLFMLGTVMLSLALMQNSLTMLIRMNQNR